MGPCRPCHQKVYPAGRKDPHGDAVGVEGVGWPTVAVGGTPGCVAWMQGDAAPKGLTRKSLCIALQRLLNDNEITNKSIIVLEADPSINNDLITKVYKPMNFELLAHGDGIKYNNRNTKTYNRGKGGLMKSTVGKTLKWCNEKRW